MTNTSIYRLNLLPPQVRQWALARRLIPIFALIFLGSVTLCVIAYFVFSVRATAAEQDALKAEASEKRVSAVESEIKSTLASVQPLQDKLDFVKKVDDYREKWISFYTRLGDRSAQSGFIYTDASVAGTTVTIKAYSPKTNDVTKYLQAMYQEPDFQSITVDKVVGFPDNARHLYYLDGQLVFADGAAAMPSSDLPSPSTIPGVPMAPQGYTPQQVGPNGADNLPPGVGPPPPQIAVRYLGGFTSKAAAETAMTSAAGYSPAFLKVAGRNLSPFTPPQIREMLLKQALRHIVVRTVPKGFDITVTATLKQPLTPPVAPGLTAPAVPNTASSPVQMMENG